MRRLSDIQISTQVYAGFGLMTALLLALAGSAWTGLGDVEEKVRRLSLYGRQGATMAAAEGAFLEARINVNVFYASKSPERRKDGELQIADTLAHLDALEATMIAEDKRKAVGDLKSDVRQYAALFQKGADFFLQAQKEGNRIFEVAVTPIFLPVQQAANKTLNEEVIAGADAALRHALNGKVQITRFLDTTTEADLAEALKYLKEARAGLEAAVKATDQGAVHRAAGTASAFLDSYQADLHKYRALVAEANQAVLQQRTFADGLNEKSAAFFERLKRDQETVAGESAAVMQSSRSFLLGVSVASLLVAVIAAVLVGRSIARPLSLVAGVIGDISAQRDLVQRVKYDAANEIGRITQGFNELMGNLHDAFEGIARNTRQVAAAAGQASAAVGQVSDGSQNQLNAINQISAAMEQTARAIGDVAGNTDQATAHARKAAELVEHGREKMSAMLQVANVISENSKKINQITDVISRIANQTNMLSLNAAIEAARAGEHGKGFAVVAEEVRKLAEHAATSVQQITELVVHAAGEAQRSLEMVNAVNADMEAIAESVRRSDAMVQGIAVAMTQQSSSVEEINANVKNLSKIGETNAAASEEITATMMELARLADQTRGQMEQFRI